MRYRVNENTLADEHTDGQPKNIMGPPLKKGNEFQQIIITYKGAYFSTDVKEGQCVFEYDEFVQLLIFFIDNIYIKFGDSIFRKKNIGIPNGYKLCTIVG